MDKDLATSQGGKNVKFLFTLNLVWNAKPWLDQEHAWSLSRVRRNEPLVLSSSDCCAKPHGNDFCDLTTLDSQSSVASKSRMIWIGGGVKEEQ